MECKFNKSEKYDTSLEELQFRFDDEEELQMNAMKIFEYQYYSSFIKKYFSLQLPKKLLITNP